MAVACPCHSGMDDEQDMDRFSSLFPLLFIEGDILWAPRENWIEAHKLEGFDVVIHLAGKLVL